MAEVSQRHLLLTVTSIGLLLKLMPPTMASSTPTATATSSTSTVKSAASSASAGLMVPPTAPVTGAIATAAPTHKTKDGLIRLLLQNAVPTPPMTTVGISAAGPSISTTASNSTVAGTKMTKISSMAVPTVTITDENQAKFIHQLSILERRSGATALDHNYQRPVSWRPDQTMPSPATKTLFVNKVIRSTTAQAAADLRYSEEPIDVEADDCVGEKLPLPYDLEKSKNLMEETERFSHFANIEPTSEDEMGDWEERVSKDGWIPSQNTLFMKVVQILHTDRLARLSVKGWEKEVVETRLIVDKTAKRLRKLLAGVLWDTKMTQWLHNTLTDVLPRPYLVAYLDTLQSLRAKVHPSLIDRMTSAKIHSHQLGVVSSAGLRLLLKRPWDPATFKSTEPLKKLPYEAIVIITPSHPKKSTILPARRKRGSHFHNMWSELFETVIEMPSPYEGEDIPKEVAEEFPVRKISKDMKITTYLHRLVKNLLKKIKELKEANSSRPIILVGWGVAAAINCQVAAMDIDNHDSLVYNSTNNNISACINLGFPFYTLEGPRGEPDDPLLDLRTPLLFIIGQNATQCRRDDIEDMREKIKGPTGLVVVGGADERLRMSKRKKRMEGVTQMMVDRCIVEEIRSFLVSVLSSPPANFSLQGFSAALGDSTRQLGMLGFAHGRLVSGGGTGKRAGRTRKKPANAGGSPSKRSKNSSPGSTPLKGGSLQSTPTAGLIGAPMGYSATDPTGARNKRKSGEMGDFSKVRKMLDMNQLPVQLPSVPTTLTIPTMMRQPVMMPTTPIPPTSLQGVVLPSGGVSFPSSSSAQLMANSPLLTNALTSPVSSGSTPTSSISMPTTPITTTLKTRPQFQTPRIPAVGSLVARPMNIATTIYGSRIASPMVQQQFVRPTQQTIMLPTVPQQPGGQVRMITSETTPSSSTMIRPTPRIVIGSANPAMTRPQVTSNVQYRKMASAGTIIRTTSTQSSSDSKDSLYFVTLPPDQLKQLESGNGLVQYQQGQMVTLVNDPKASQVGKPNVYFTGTGPSQIASSGPKLVTTFNTTAASSLTSPSPSQSQSDRRNVAEILASLSGLKPVDPPVSGSSSVKAGSSKSSSRSVSPVAVKTSSNLVIEPITSASTTSPTPVTTSQGVTITALKSAPATTTVTSTVTTSTTSTSVKILTRTSGRQKDEEHKDTKKTEPSHAEKEKGKESSPELESPPTSATPRSRKQVFDPADLKKENVEEAGDGDAKEDECLKPVAMESKVEYEQDILEEDLEDLDYVPYKKGKGNGKKKGKNSGKKSKE